ncbi:MAG: hypothetical protein R3D55_07310 [Chloroflexota bacterium]
MNKPETSNSASQPAKPEPKPKASWQKPKLSQLRISLDTALSTGSGFDGILGSTPPSS